MPRSPYCAREATANSRAEFNLGFQLVSCLQNKGHPRKSTRKHGWISVGIHHSKRVAVGASCNVLKLRPRIFTSGLAHVLGRASFVALSCDMLHMLVDLPLRKRP